MQLPEIIIYGHPMGLEASKTASKGKFQVILFEYIEEEEAI